MAKWLVPARDANALAQKIDQLLQYPETVDNNAIQKFDRNNVLQEITTGLIKS